MKNTFINKNGIYLIIGMCILLLSIVCLIENNMRNIRNRHSPNTISHEGFDMFGITKDTNYLEPVKETISAMKDSITSDIYLIYSGEKSTPTKIPSQSDKTKE